MQLLEWFRALRQLLLPMSLLHGEGHQRFGSIKLRACFAFLIGRALGVRRWGQRTRLCCQGGLSRKPF